MPESDAQSVRAVKTAQQSTQNGGVAGDGNSFSLSVELFCTETCHVEMKF